MTIPTYSDLYTSVQTDLRKRLGITSIFGKVILNIFAAVQAAKLKIYYLGVGFVYKNIFPDQADPSSKGGSLERFGYVRLGRYPYAATAGEYKASITGEIGATIAPNTTFKSLDTSTNPDKLFILDSAYTFTSTSGIIDLRALDLGTDAALEVGDQLQVTAPIANVDSFATITSVDVTATEAEDIEEYRQEVIDSFRNEPQGGARIDYREWSNGVPGIRQVYPYVTVATEVDLYIEANPDDSTDGHGTPSASLMDDVQDAIEPSKIPLGVSVINYAAVAPAPVDVEIADLSDDSYLTAIESAIESFLFNVRPFVDGADDVIDINKGKLYAADIYGIVRDVLGRNATFTSLVVEVNSVSIQSYEFTVNVIPYINSVTSV